MAVTYDAATGAENFQHSIFINNVNVIDEFFIVAVGAWLQRDAIASYVSNGCLIQKNGYRLSL